MKWRKELSDYTGNQKALYGYTGIQVLFDRIETLNAWVARIDEIYGNCMMIKSSLSENIRVKKDVLDIGVTTVLESRLATWTAAGMSASERLMRAERSMLDAKIDLSKIRNMANLLENFVSYLQEKKVSLMKAKYDCNVSKDLLDIGIRLGEVK